MLKIKCFKSKKGNECVALTYEKNDGSEVYISFDVETMSRISGKSVREIYRLEVGDSLYIE